MQAVRICTFRMLHFLTGPASIMLTCIVVINWLLLLLNATPLGRCMKYCGQHVCLSICPLTCLKNRVSVARSCFDENTSRCVDDVMFSHMAPVGHIQRQRMFSSSSPGDDTILMSVDVMYG